MSFNNILKRELEFAFSKHAQPVWFRIVKYVVIGFIIYFFWGTRFIWYFFSTMLVVGLALHFWYRHKTKGWTRSYGMWKFHKKD